jgi:hypothetical protein
LAGLLVAVAVAARPASPGDASDAAPNVILVTTDGLRWQEVFSGADAALMTEAEGVARPEPLRRAFWRESPEERRLALLPFLWGTVAKKGQLYGNQRRRNVVRVTNGKNFSYPGYNEMLAGYPDPGIDSNDKRPNPNVTVLEWLDRRPGFAHGVAAFCCWDVFPFILNRERSGLLVNAGWEPADERPLAESIERGKEAGREIPEPWGACRFDVLTFEAAREHLVRRRPRVLYVSLGETDEWGHLGRYGEYLEAAHRVDRLVQRLWETAESLPGYRGNTSLVFTTDHGRGEGHAWRDHGQKVAGSDGIWLAVLGPRTAALGERTGGEPFTQGQVAATVAALAGEDYGVSVPQAASPVGPAVRAPRLY